MLLGSITLCFFVLAAVSFLPRRLRLCKRDQALRVFHIAVGAALPVLAAVHGALSLKLIRQRPAAMVVLGMLAFVLLLLCLVSGIFFQKRGKIHRLAAWLLGVVIVCHGAVGLYSFQSYQKQLDAVGLEEIDLKQIPDGVYEGECDVGYIYAKVRITVEDGVLGAAELLEHRHERGAAAQRLTGEMVRRQTTVPDAVSGATNSSKVILGAVQNALAR